MNARRSAEPPAPPRGGLGRLFRGDSAAVPTSQGSEDETKVGPLWFIACGACRSGRVFVFDRGALARARALRCPVCDGTGFVGG